MENICIKDFRRMDQIFSPCMIYKIQVFFFHSFWKIKDTTIAIVNNETLEAKFLRSWSVRNTRSNFLSLYDIKIQLKFSFPFISIKIKDTTIAIVNNNKTFKEIFEKLEYKKYKILGIIPKILNAKNFDTSNSVCVCVCVGIANEIVFAVFVINEYSAYWRTPNSLYMSTSYTRRRCVVDAVNCRIADDVIAISASISIRCPI